MTGFRLPLPNDGCWGTPVDTAAADVGGVQAKTFALYIRGVAEDGHKPYLSPVSPFPLFAQEVL
jgi:hypothetical protein